jgi:hypothetical protein
MTLPRDSADFRYTASFERGSGFDYGRAHRNVGATMYCYRALAAGIIRLTADLAVPTTSCDAQESEFVTAITCANPVSGASWQIVIDYRRATVDSNPANITRSGISWFDPKDGGNYTLDRETGNLTASVASSTGGYFRHNRCNLKTSR